MMSGISFSIMRIVSFDLAVGWPYVIFRFGEFISAFFYMEKPMPLQRCASPELIPSPRRVQAISLILIRFLIFPPPFVCSTCRKIQGES